MEPTRIERVLAHSAPLTFTILVLVTRGWMLAIDGSETDALLLLDLLKSDGAIIGFVWAASLGRPFWWHGLAALVLGLLQLVAFNFFRVTGFTFGFSHLTFAAERAGEVADVVGSETPALLLGACFVYVVLVAVSVWAARKSGSRLGRANLVAVMLLLLSFTPPIGEVNRPFRKTPLSNLAWTAADTALLSGSSERVEPRRYEPARLTRTSEAPPPNVVFVILESTRWEATSLGNPARDTTPFLAELAASSIVATSARAVVPHTSKALVALLCGIEPLLRMPIVEAEPHGIPVRCLPELLRDAGYETGFFQTARGSFENRRTLTANMGYGHTLAGEDLETEGFEVANYFGVEDLAMLDPALRWMQGVEGPFMATLLTLTPHHDYQAPRRFGRLPFDQDDEFNRYLNSVHYVDNFLRVLVEQMVSRGLMENTMLVVVGDHGEGFGEHGRRQHDSVIYEEGLHVPLVIARPGVKEKVSIPWGVTHLDLLPTVVDLLGYELEGTYPGTSMLRLNEERPLPSHCWYERSCLSIVEGDQKFVHHYGIQPDEWFDLTADPGERNSIIASIDEERVARRRAGALEWVDTINATFEAHHQSTLASSVRVTPPSLENEVAVDLGFASVVGYELRAMSSEEARLTMAYKVTAEPPPGLEFTLHLILRPESGPPLDLRHVPVNGLLPISSWEPGTYVVDEVTVPLVGGTRQWTMHAGIAPGHSVPPLHEIGTLVLD